MFETVTGLSISNTRNLLIVSETVEVLLRLPVIQSVASMLSNYTTWASRTAEAVVESPNTTREKDVTEESREDHA